MLCRINRQGVATLATLFKNGAERYAGTCMLIIEMDLAAEITLIYQDFFHIFRRKLRNVD